MKYIVIVQAHPDGGTKHYCHALAESYQAAATQAGHHVDLINLAIIDIPFLHSKVEWESSEDLPKFVVEAQNLIEKADHLVFIYPLWLGTMPALLKAWLEQVLRSPFAFNIASNGKRWSARLGGQSARVIITMGMPALFYRWFYFSHSARSFERNILKFCGIKPVKMNLIGMVERKDGRARQKWLEKMKQYGRVGN